MHAADRAPCQVGRENCWLLPLLFLALIRLDHPYLLLGAAQQGVRLTEGWRLLRLASIVSAHTRGWHQGLTGRLGEANVLQSKD